jgi:exonuclease SbcC
MIPRRIRLWGFLSYKEEREIHFEGSSLWMLSGMNGSGKSSIFDAITFALFGHHRGGALQASELMNKDSNQLGVEFDFTLDGELFRVSRTMKRTAQGRISGTQQVSRQILDSLNEAHWEPALDTNKKTDFDKWIAENIGLNFETFTSSVLLLQGRAEKLLDSSPKGRAELLASIVDLERFQKLHERATQRKNTLKGQVERTESQLAAIPQVTEMELLAIENRLTEIGAERSETQHELQRWTQLEFQARRFEELSERRKSLVGESHQIEQLFAEREKIGKDHERFRLLQAMLPHLSNLQSHRSAQDTANLELKKLTKAKTEQEEKRTQIAHQLDQLLKEKHGYDSQLQREQNELTRLNEKRLELAGIMPKIEEFERTLRELSQLPEQKKRFRADPEHELKQLQQQLEQMLEIERVLPELKRFRERRETLLQGQTRLKELEGKESKIKKSGEELRTQHETLKGKVTAAEEEQKRIERERATADALAQQADQALEEFQRVDGKKSCIYCGSPLTKEHLASELKSRKQQQKERKATCQHWAKEEIQGSETLAKFREQLKQNESQLEAKREEFREWKSERAQLLKEVENATREIRHIYDNLPERYRMRVSPKLPDDWLSTEYPSLEETRDLETRRKEGESLRSKLETAKTALGDWQRLQAQEANLKQQAERLKRELPSKEVSLLREEDLTVRGQHSAITSQLKTTEAVLKRTQQGIELRSQELQRLTQEIAQTSSKIKVEESTLSHFAESIRQSQKLLPDAWRETGITLGLAELQQLKGELNELDQSKIVERFDRLAEGRTLLDRLKSDLTELDTQLNEIPVEARKGIASVKLEIQRLNRMREEIEQRLKSIEKEQAILKRHAEQRQELLSERLIQERDHNSYRTLSELLGRDRLQRHLVRVAERQIVEYANAVLDRLSGGELSLRLCGSEEGASAERALELEAFNRATADRAINVAFLSGSQRFRVAVSLALGIGQYASKQHRPIESVIIDEGFGCLDRDGRQVMIQELQNLRSNLRCILLVSHQEEFADAFPDGYRFELQNGATQVTRLRR